MSLLGREAPSLSRQGKKIVLAASNSESNEFMQSSWRQMLLATLPQKYAHLFTGWSLQNETWPDGQAKYVPHGLRIVESLLRQRFAPDDIVVCYPEQLDQFVGPETRAVGVHAHNPLGITFATDVYSGFYGSAAEPINAAEFRRLITHPVLRQYKANFKLIVGRRPRRVADPAQEPAKRVGHRHDRQRRGRRRRARPVCRRRRG
ncbi:MAG: hypothetical protein MUC42_03025 [Bryobacter sp.]|nr:hypothetical protein [Bryobacter sp.]